MFPARFLSSPLAIKDVSSEFVRSSVLSLLSPLTTGKASLAMVRIPLLESVVNRDGVCDLDGAFEEFLDDGLGFCERLKSSMGISSERGRTNRGLLSRDLGVFEPDLFLDTSLGFGVFIGTVGCPFGLLLRCSLDEFKQKC